MTTISALFIQNVARSAGYDLLDEGRLLSDGEEVFSVQIDSQSVGAEQYYQLMLWILENCPDRAELALEHARTLDIDRMGILGLACKAAPTIGGSFRRMERYFRILAENVRYHLEPSDTQVFLRQQVLVPPNPALVITREGGLGAVINIMRSISKTDVPLDAVSFEHSAPDNILPYEEFFGCPVEFNAPSTGLLMQAEVLDTPNRLGDRALSSYLDTQIEQAISDIKAKDTIEHQIPKLVSDALPEGLPTAAGIARQLGMSERTLHRRLADIGKTYRAICEATQNEIARGLLANPDHPIAEIAFLTGFSEQSAFTRAFKRWAGETPARFRRRAVSI